MPWLSNVNATEMSANQWARDSPASTLQQTNLKQVLPHKEQVKEHSSVSSLLTARTTKSCAYYPFTIVHIARNVHWSGNEDHAPSQESNAERSLRNQFTDLSGSPQMKESTYALKHQKYIGCQNGYLFCPRHLAEDTIYGTSLKRKWTRGAVAQYLCGWRPLKRERQRHCEKGTGRAPTSAITHQKTLVRV